MRVMIVEVDGMRIEFSLNTSIESIRNQYKELKEMDSEMNIIEYKEVQDNEM